MPLVIADRVRETTTTSGTGTLTLAGPYSGFQAFSVIGNGNTTYYAIIDAQNGAWEVGIGAYTTSGNTLSRATVLASSNAGSLVNFGTGTKDVILTQPARRSVLVQEGGSGLITGVAAFTANGVPYADSTSTLATSANMTFNGTRLTVADLADSGLTSGRVTYASTGGALVDSANLTFDGTNLTLGGGTANGVAYLNGSKVLTTGSALTFDGTKLTNTGSAGGVRLEIVSTSSSPEISLTSADTGTSQINFGGATTPKKGVFRYSDNSDLFVWLLNSNTEQMRLTSTGLGIGTSSPAVRLHAFTSGVSTQAFFESGTGASVIRFKDSTTTDTFAPQFGSAGNSMFWQIAGSEQMRLTSTGLGIGTTSPNYVATLYKASLPVLQLANSTSGSTASDGLLMYLNGSNAVISNQETGSLAFETSGLTRATLDSSGNLGLGVTPNGSWEPTAKAIQISNAGQYIASGSTTFSGANQLWLGNNGYLNSSGQWIYLRSVGASQYRQLDNAHAWYTAPSGTAGNAISFTQVLTVAADGKATSTAVGVDNNFTLNSTAGAYSTTLTLAAAGGGGSTINATGASSDYLRFAITGTERARIDSSGNLLVGVSFGSNHIFSKNAGNGAGTTNIFEIQNAGSDVVAIFLSGTSYGTSNSAGTSLRIGRSNTTSRSINAGGTINASGADYAEYMTKASDFTVAKGDVLGINADGKLTNVFADAVSFCVKSTDPSYVGNDKWGCDFSEDPEGLEAARQLVDRIAFAGQVPVNVMGATPGQYIVPVSDNGAIKGIAKNEADMTLAEYMKAVGKVIAIEADGRAKIIVKVA